MSRGCFLNSSRAVWLGALLALLGAAGLTSWLAPPAAAGRVPRAPRAHAAYAQQCADPYPATRDPSNPLDLPTPPGANPLNGARFFVDGPRHGAAAGAIEKLLGVDPTRQSASESWPTSRPSSRTAACIASSSTTTG